MDKINVFPSHIKRAIALLITACSPPLWATYLGEYICVNKTYPWNRNRCSIRPEHSQITTLRNIFCLMAEVKTIPSGAWKALGVPTGWGTLISRQSAQEGNKVCQPWPQDTFTPQEIFLLIIAVRSWDDPTVIVAPDWLCHWKISKTPLKNCRSTKCYLQIIKSILDKLTGLCRFAFFQITSTIYMEFTEKTRTAGRNV
jgi:hypothetical protein